ncbi:MAG: putative arabinose efflux permease, family [Hyphomicrobiales bacterium]|nr:putative arabinose efflux permease, family [Hyphomicrobiales bacterium]
MLVPLALSALASAIANRAMDPLVTSLARDFDVPVTTAAMAISFYALPYAFGQPILGPMGDFYGKIRMLRICLWLQALCLAVVVLSPTIGVLFAARFLGGLAGGGIMPVAMALIGDKVAPAQRQLAMGRFLSAGLLGMIFAASIAGLLAEFISWRAVFLIGLVIAVASAVAVSFYVTDRDPPRPAGRLSVAHAIAGYRRVFANPRAALCYGTVFIEGLALYGMMPYVAELLETRRMGGPTEAGVILAGVGVGGLFYSLSLKWLLRWLRRTQMMALGGVLASAGVFGMAWGLPWQAAAAVFCATGLGYMLMHNSVQAEVAGLTAENRGSAFSMHSFSFFCGQALGPILVGMGMQSLGAEPTLVICGLVLLALGPAIAFLFGRLRQGGGRAF